MRRALRILLWVLAVLTAALGGLAGYVYTHQDELKAAMLSAVNERLSSPVQIGALEVDLWGRFPDVSLRDGKTRQDGKRHGYCDPFPDHANRWRTRTRSRPSRPVKDTSGT